MTNTPCHLTVLNILTAPMVEELAPLLEEMNPNDPDVAEALSENSVIRFEAVFEGDMPTELLHWFNRNKVSFAWEWEAFYGTGGGCNFFEPETNEVYHIRLHEELPVMSVREAADPAKVEQMVLVLNQMEHRRAKLGIN